MPKAVRFHSYGDPDVLRLEEVAVGDPGPGEVRVRHVAIGVNYVDTYHRTGLYKLPLPSGIGLEGAGVIEAVGDGVVDLRPNDRVAYCSGPPGAYSETRVMPADRLVPLPSGIAERSAAAIMLKGLTVQYLFRQTRPLNAGDTILFHAAAGGVGLIACQWARALGVTMIGTVGSDEKAALVKAHGCTHAIVYSRENFVERVKELTDGKGVPVVYDSVGKRYVSRVARLPVAKGPVRELRQFVGSDLRIRYRPSHAEGIAVRNAADDGFVRHVARETARNGRRSLRSGAIRQDQGGSETDLRARRCEASASRSRVAQDHGRHASTSLVPRVISPRRYSWLMQLCVTPE